MTNDEKRALVLQWAESQLGVTEYTFGSNKVKYNDWFYGKAGATGPWCMAEVQRVFDRAGLPLPAKTPSCSVLANYAKQHGQWVTSGYKPGYALGQGQGSSGACGHRQGGQGHLCRDLRGQHQSRQPGQRRQRHGAQPCICQHHRGISALVQHGGIKRDSPGAYRRRLWESFLFVAVLHNKFLYLCC